MGWRGRVGCGVGACGLLGGAGERMLGVAAIFVCGWAAHLQGARCLQWYLRLMHCCAGLQSNTHLRHLVAEYGAWGGEGVWDVGLGHVGYWNEMEGVHVWCSGSAFGGQVASLGMGPRTKRAA
jgi:hypothetical protein